MVRIVINHFKSKNQERIKFVQILNEYAKTGLKEGKLLMDSMLDGKPIEVDIEKEQLGDFVTVLDDLNMEYKLTV